MRSKKKSIEKATSKRQKLREGMPRIAEEPTSKRLAGCQGKHHLGGRTKRSDTPSLDSAGGGKRRQPSPSILFKSLNG